MAGDASPAPPRTLINLTTHSTAMPKSRMCYILLAIFLGTLGIHNFYAGYQKNGLIQLLITVISCGFLSIVSWIWAIVDICNVQQDANGVPFTN